MKGFFRLLIITAFVLLTGSAFAKSKVVPVCSSPSITLASSGNLVNETCPIPPATSLIAYRYRHGIDENHETVLQPIEITTYITPSMFVNEGIADNHYFFSYPDLIPPPPDFLFHSALRSPPAIC